MKNITLKQVANAIEEARDHCTYFPGMNQTYGPYSVRNLNGPSTSRYYDHRRGWNTQIAKALAEEAFNVDLSNYEITNMGPWRDTVRSIHRAVNEELTAEREYQTEIE